MNSASSGGLRKGLIFSMSGAGVAREEGGSVRGAPASSYMGAILQRQTRIKNGTIDYVFNENGTFFGRPPPGPWTGAAGWTGVHSCVRSPHAAFRNPPPDGH